MKKTSLIILFGIILSYISLLFVHRLLFFPLPFVIFYTFAYMHFSDYKKSLFVTAVFAIPYSMGKAIIQVESNFLFSFSPFLISVLLLSLLSIKNIPEKIKIPDIFLLLFLFWGLGSFVILNTNEIVLDGLFWLVISVLFYSLSKIYLRDPEVKKTVVLILISFLIWESCITIFQFFLQKPIGLFIEEGTNIHPFGKLAEEVQTLYRASGSMAEPTWLARFLTILLPLILFKLDTIISLSSTARFVIAFLAIIAIFVSFTRTSWLITLIVISLFYLVTKPKISVKKYFNYKSLIFILFFIVSVIFFFPYFTLRWQVTPISFEEGGSFDLRIKLMQEAYNLISLFPWTGVGLNQFSIFAQKYNVTNFSQFFIAPVHNVPLLIASEMGLPALFLFSGFVASSYKVYIDRRRKLSNITRNLIDAVAISGFAYLLESMMGTIFLSPHLLLFILYMSIIQL